MPHSLLHSERMDVLLAHAAEFVRSEAAAGEVLLIGATSEAADDFARGLCDSAIAGLHRLTTRRLAAALAQSVLTARGIAPISSAIREALAARVVDTACAGGSLTYFAPVAATRGFPRALARTLDGLRMARITPAALQDAAGPRKDLAILLRLYEAELSGRSLADNAARFAAATAVIRTCAHPLCGLPILLLDVALHSAVEEEFLQVLSKSAPSLLAVAQSADAARMESVLGLNGTSFACSVRDSLSSVQQHLFSGAEIPARVPDPSCELLSASGEALEAVEIARRLRDAAEAGLPFDSMAILLRAPDRYQPVIEEALRRAGIPAYFTRGTRRPDVAGRAFLALLHCALESLSASRFGEYLSLGQVPALGDEEVRAPAGWERLIVDASVIGGKDRWERRLSGLPALLLAKYASAEDEAEQARYRRDLDCLESLAKFALPVVEQLAGLPRKATWGEWIERLYELAGVTLREPGGVRELLDDLRLMEDIGPVELFDIARVLEERLRFLRLEPESNRYGRVLVAGIEEARGMCFRLVVLPGLNEGSFPRPVAEDPLLLDEYKDAISPALRKTSEEDEQRLLRTAAACASERLIASYSRMDLLTGRPRVLSLYAFELLQAARGAGLDVRDIEAEARRGAETRVGWPAPVLPGNAIDDAEFDLATLHPAFQGTAGKGVGAYLTKVNERLVSSLRARGRRWRPKWYGADGLADPDIEMLRILEEYRPGVRAYSPSALQQYAVCPYKFVLRAIHRLHPAEEPAPLERMDPRIRGSLYHSVQFHLLRELRARDLLPLDEGGRDVVFDALDRWVRDVAAEFAEKLAPAIPHIWKSELAGIRADLRGWVQRMISTDPGWTPLAFELSFGMQPDDRHDPRSVREPVTVLGRFRLKGSIDLVERHSSGLLRVVDHKTGKPPSPLPQCVGKGEVLQPVLYALAAEQILNEKVVTGRLHYATLRANYRSVDVPMGETSRRRMEQVLTTIDNALHNGFLPAAPRAKACESCDYLSVCGPYEEERVTIKPNLELKPLRDLRGLP